MSATPDIQKATQSAALTNNKGPKGKEHKERKEQKVGWPEEEQVQETSRQRACLRVQPYFSRAVALLIG